MSIFNGRKTVEIGYVGKDPGDRIVEATDVFLKCLREAGVPVSTKIQKEGRYYVYPIDGGGSVKIEPGLNNGIWQEVIGIIVDSKLGKKKVNKVSDLAAQELARRGFESCVPGDKVYFCPRY